jgi:GGDEF domain-containing protein
VGKSSSLFCQIQQLSEALAIAENLRKLISKEKFSHFNLPLTITLGVTERHKENDNALKMR